VHSKLFALVSGTAVIAFAIPAARSQSVTRSATFNPVLQVDGGSSSTGLNFTGISYPIRGVTTTINLTKCDTPINLATGACQGLGDSYNDEIQLRLQSPSGTIRTLVPGGTLSGQTPGASVTWTFSDAASSLVSGSSLISGTYLPNQSLGAFIGENGNGNWSLLFTDWAEDDPLTINSWGLTLLWTLPYNTVQPYANIQSVGLDALKNQRELVLNQAGNCDQRGWVVYDSDKGKDPSKTKKKQSFCVFAEGGYATGSINGTSTLGGYDTRNASSAFGVEWKASQQWAIGAAYGYGTANLGGYNFQDTTASIDSNINSGNIYAVYRPDKNWKIAALGGYSGFSYSGNRTFLGDTSDSSFSANGYTAAIQASYDIILSKDYNNKKNPLNPVRVRPLIGLAWGSHQQDGFNETGDGTLVNVQGQTTNSLMATLGASLEAPIPLNSSKITVLTPRVGVAYQYDFLANQNGNKSITAVFQDDPTTSFTEVGQNRGANSVYLDLGADLQINPNLVLYASVNYQAFTNGNQFGYQGGVRVKF
jgi:uncharacterized protein YhjY with autotransporter beta-barrel domain